MSITYTWSFPQFEVAPTENNLNEVVKVIHWRLDGLDNIYSAGAYGTVSLSDPDLENFTLYKDINEKWAIDVVSNIIDLKSIKSAISKEINNKKNPPMVSMQPPFNIS